MTRRTFELLAVGPDLGQVSFSSLVYRRNVRLCLRHNLDDEAAHRRSEAAAEFQKILDHRGVAHLIVESSLASLLQLP